MNRGFIIFYHSWTVFVKLDVEQKDISKKRDDFLKNTIVTFYDFWGNISFLKIASPKKTFGKIMFLSGMFLINATKQIGGR